MNERPLPTKEVAQRMGLLFLQVLFKAIEG
jgi:hypothetical protein